MRDLRISAFVLTCALTLSALGAAKQPWQWTLEERIAERCDRSAARGRVERARAQRLAPTTVKGGKVVWHHSTDAIIGKHSPHLLLPTEVFESVVRNGFLVEGWRQAYAAQIAESGLPPSFWEQLEKISTLYVEDLREEQRLGLLGSGAVAYALKQALESRLCADRADALEKARVLFGPALDVFMYRHIAPTKSLHIDHLEDPDALVSREQGCR